MAVSLRPLTPADAPSLQRLYDVCPAAFMSLLGRAAPPDLAANDLRQAQATPARYQFGVFLVKSLIGFIDCSWTPTCRIGRTWGCCSWPRRMMIPQSPPRSSASSPAG